MSQKFSEPKKERKLVRRVAKRWNDASPSSCHIRVERIEQSRKRARKMAVITVAGSRSDFYDPAVAIVNMLDDARDPVRQPGPLRVLNPSEVTSTALVEAPRADWAHATTHLKRMRKIGGFFITCWGAGPVPRGRFYLYPDRLLYQAFDRETGWINLKVPEEGMNWDVLEKFAKTNG